MDGVARGLAEDLSEIGQRESGSRWFPLKQDVVGRIRPFLLVLLAAVGLCC